MAPVQICPATMIAKLGTFVAGTMQHRESSASGRCIGSCIHCLSASVISPAQSHSRQEKITTSSRKTIKTIGRAGASRVQLAAAAKKIAECVIVFGHDTLAMMPQLISGIAASKRKRLRLVEDGDQA
jgi:hypothetical protein